MKDNTLIIVIDRPIDEVFDYIVNPQNTSKWVSSIEREETNEWPVRVGTLYKNKDTNGAWSEYRLVELKKPSRFALLDNKENNFSVSYTLKAQSDHATVFEYHESVKDGIINEPFTIEGLTMLKTAIES